MEQLTVDCVCHVLSEPDCELLSDEVLWVCELDSLSQLKCLCFIGHEASSAKLAAWPLLRGGLRWREELCQVAMESVADWGRFAAAEGLGDLSLRAFCFQRLTLSHNEAVTSYLLEAMSTSPDLHDADNDANVCK